MPGKPPRTAGRPRATIDLFGPAAEDERVARLQAHDGLPAHAAPISRSMSRCTQLAFALATATPHRARGRGSPAYRSSQDRVGFCRIARRKVRRSGRPSSADDVRDADSGSLAAASFNPPSTTRRAAGKSPASASPPAGPRRGGARRRAGRRRATGAHSPANVRARSARLAIRSGKAASILPRSTVARWATRRWWTRHDHIAAVDDAGRMKSEAPGRSATLTGTLRCARDRGRPDRPPPCRSRRTPRRSLEIRPAASTCTTAPAARTVAALRSAGPIATTTTLRPATSKNSGRYFTERAPAAPR